MVGYDYVATDFLYLNEGTWSAVLAFTPGMAIPNDTVTRFGWLISGQAVEATPAPPAPEPSVITITTGEVS